MHQNNGNLLENAFVSEWSLTNTDKTVPTRDE